MQITYIIINQVISRDQKAEPYYFVHSALRLPTSAGIGGGSIYKVGGPDAEDVKGMGEGLRGGVSNLYQLFVWK